MSKNEHKTPNRRSARPTVGYLAPAIHGGSLTQWCGVVDAAQKHNLNLICFPGWSLHDPRGFQAQANILYDLVDAETIDGLVSWASSIGNYADADELEAFHERYRPLPMVTIGRTLEGIPSVLMDSYVGMREAISHLIEVHGHRHLAFIRGPEGHFYAQERYRAYVETLEAYGLPFDPDLVTPPAPWGEPTGREAIHLLLDERKLRPQTDVRAIVAANDNLLLGALEVLQAREIRVPEDIAIVGFDNRVEGRASTPPLTSVVPGFYETGYQAVETLLAVMEGEQVPEEKVVPSKLVVRRSCGCPDSAVAQAAVGPVKPPSKTVALRETIATQRAQMLSDIVQATGDHTEGAASGWAEQLLDSFVVEMEGESPGLFLSTLEGTLHQVMGEEGAHSAGLWLDRSSRSGQQPLVAWQGVLSVLRRNVLPHLDGEARSRAEDLWQQARVVIGETTRRRLAYQSLQAEQQTQTLREINAALITTFDMDELMVVLARYLPGLQIPSAYLSLYEDPNAPTEWAQLMLAYDEKGRTELKADERRFPSRRLVPEEMWPNRPRSYVTEPLYFRKEQIGFVLFEVGPRDGNVYQILRGEISSALYGALLLRERKRIEGALELAYARMEQQVHERTAELEREIVERERTQEENMRLQQQMIDTQRHAIEELSTPIIPVLERVIVMPLIGSIDTMRARDITRRLLAGIRENQARVVILDITGVPIVDSGVANHLNKTIQAASLKGARTIVTGISDAVAETIVDLGIDWSEIETLADLQTGLRTVLVEMRGQS